MIRLFALPARVKLWLVVLVGALIAWWGRGKLGERKGRLQERAKVQAKAAKAHKKTVERVLDETATDDTADFVRKRMRERSKR